MGLPSELVERRLWSELEERPDIFAARLIDLPPADVVDILNRLRLADAAAVLETLPASRVIEVFDQPTLHRRSAIIAQLEPAARPRSWKAFPPTSAPTSSAPWASASGAASCPSSARR